jgi:Ion channel
MTSAAKKPWWARYGALAAVGLLLLLTTGLIYWTAPDLSAIADVLSTIAGCSILFLVGFDVYGTILHARARSGPVSETLNRGVWRLTRSLAFRLSRGRRHQLLNAVGPLLLPTLIAILIALLMFGFALIYWPHLPEDFSVDEKAKSPRWIEALYFSGITLTTLGYGDIAPRSTAMRLVALSESSVGLFSISLAVTYLITVAGALERKRIVASSFYHQAEEGADAASFIARHFVNGKFYGLENIFAQAARDLRGLLESHVEHPVIHYFHPIEVHKSLPRILFLVLETSSILQCCVDAEKYPETCRRPEVRTLDETARYVLGQLVVFLGLVGASEYLEEAPVAEPARWQVRYRQTMMRLSEAGIQVRADSAVGLRRYYENRLYWEKRLGLFSRFLGYDWDEITGDRDLRHAEDQLTIVEDPGE